MSTKRNVTIETDSIRSSGSGRGGGDGSNGGMGSRQSSLRFSDDDSVVSGTERIVRTQSIAEEDPEHEDNEDEPDELVLEPEGEGDEEDGEESLASKLFSLPPLSIIDEQSQFTSDIADTMELLRVAATRDLSTKAAMKAFHAVHDLCHKRFYAKARLGACGASDQLAFLFKHWKHHPEVTLLAAKTLSEYTMNENPNKIHLGCLGVCEAVVIAIENHKTDHQLLFHLFGLAIDLCNSRLTGLLQEHVYDKAPKPTKTTPTKGGVSPPPKNNQPSKIRPGASEQYYQLITTEAHLKCDNRVNLREAGLIHRLARELHHQSKHSHKYFITEEQQSELSNYKHKGIANHKDYLLKLCQCVATLSSNDDNSKLLGEEGICESLTKVFTHEIQDEGYGHGHDTTMAVSLLNAMIILSSDPRTGNRQRFASNFTCIPIIQLLHDFMRNINKYNKIIPKEFARLVEYASWALLNLCIECPDNIYSIHGISFSEVVIENLLELDLPLSAYTKLKKAYEIIFRNKKYPKIVVTMIGNNDENVDGELIASDTTTDEQINEIKDVPSESIRSARGNSGKACLNAESKESDLSKESKSGRNSAKEHK